MKNNKVAALFLALSLLFCISPKIYAISGGGSGGSRSDTVSLSEWYSMSDDERFYTARSGAIDKGYDWKLTYSDYSQNKNGTKDFILHNGYCFTWSQQDCDIHMNTHYNYPGFMGIPSGDYVTFDKYVQYGIIDDGSENFDAYGNAVDNATSQGKKDDFYNGGSNTTIDASGITQTGPGNDPVSIWGDVYDLGNGYYIKPEFLMQVRYTDTDPWWQQVYDIAHIYYQDTEITNATISSSTSRFKLISKFPNYWISQENDRYYFCDHWESPDLSGGIADGRVDITQWVTYIPNGMSENDIVPKVIKLWEPPTYEPVDGSDQTGVNEEIQKQNNDIISWLEKIYNAELMINSTIGNLLNPLNNLYSAINNCYSILNSILNKLDNLTVKLKDWQGNEFKIELGDLELGDLNIDFDVVYNVTGITKITSPGQIMKNVDTYKSGIESKLGITNMKTNINNMTSALFGQNIFGSSGNVVSGSISDSAALPHLYFTFMGHTYDLFDYLSLIPSETVNAWKQICTFFIFFGTALAVIRYIPSFIGGVGNFTVQQNISDIQLFEDSHLFNLQNRGIFENLSNSHDGFW